MRDKISFLTDVLENTFGTKMQCHRGGRWGFNNTYARILVERGYLVDCSVTPLTSWTTHSGDPARAGGPDYSRFPQAPYFIDLDDISRVGKSPLLEIPVTAMEMQRKSTEAIRQRFRPGSMPRRALNRLLPPLGLLALNQHNLRISLRVLERSVALKPRCVHVALHSSNLMPGGSPQFPGVKDVEALYDVLHQILAFGSRHFRGATMTEFRREFQEA
jgi:hypothetical protein